MRRFWFLPFLPLFLLVACSGELAGTIFLDENANNLLDSTEKGISRAVFLVRKDGVLITSGVSDAQGKYSIKIKENGYYCVEVDKSVERQGVAVWTAKSLGVKTAGDTTTATEEEPAKEPKKEEEKPKEKEEETHEPGVTTYDPKKTCSEVTSSHATLSVSVPKNFKAMRLPEDAEQSISVGEVVELQFFCPVSCPRLPLYLPRELEVVSRSRFYDANINRLQFSESRTTTAGDLIPATSVVEDPLVAEKFPVRLKERMAIEEDKSLPLTLQCQCPDGTVVASNSVTLKVGLSDPVDVRQSVTRLGNGEQRQIEVTVENLTGGTYRRAELVVELPHLPNMDAVLIGGNIGTDACSNLEVKFLCHLDLAPGETKAISYRFSLPTEIATPTDYTAKAKVTLRENNQIIEAEDVVIPLGNPAE